MNRVRLGVVSSVQRAEVQTLSELTSRGDLSLGIGLNYSMPLGYSGPGYPSFILEYTAISDASKA